MRFGFVTDELSQDPREAIETALAWDVRDFELRFVQGVRFPRHTGDTLDHLAALREEYNIRYTAVSPGFFKCSLKDEAALHEAFGEFLDRGIEFMCHCQVPLMICFSFELDSGTDDEAVGWLQRLADRLAEHGLAAAIENERDQFCTSPQRIVEILENVNRPNMGANWDLGNLKDLAPEGFPNGYERVKPFIRNVHAKDVAILNGGATEWRPIGEGVCDWRGQMQALARDGAVEHVTIENHCGPLIEVGRRNLDTLSRFLNEA
jgi:sugar phosphate isomerase/epimerase